MNKNIYIHETILSDQGKHKNEKSIIKTTYIAIWKRYMYIPCTCTDKIHNNHINVKKKKKCIYL